MEGGDGVAGMGEGQGEKDVGDEIEESGQLENLDGQQDEETDEKAKDSDKPIEMEDDFVANLEGIDDTEGKDESDDEQQEDGTEQADWDVGDLGEQEDEKQLDPKLWDNSTDVQQQTDQEDQAANEEVIRFEIALQFVNLFFLDRRNGGQ